MLLAVAAAFAFDVTDPACAGQRTEFTSTLGGATSWSWSINNVHASDEASVEWIFSDVASYPVRLDMETAGDDVHETADVEVFETPVVTLGGAIDVIVHDQDNYLATGPAGATYTWAVEGGTLLGASDGDEVVVEWGEVAQGRIEVSGKGSGPCAGVEHLDVAISLPSEGDSATDTGEDEEPGCGCASSPNGSLTALFALVPFLGLSRRARRRGR